MLKKIGALLFSLVLVLSLVGCSDDTNSGVDDNTNSSDTTTSEPTIDIKTVDDFQESQGLIKYFIIDEKKFSIPETVGEYANYLSQLGTVTLNDTENAVEDETIVANGISSMVAYLNVETEDGDEQRFLLRYENPTDKKISVAEAKITQIEVKYDPYSANDFEKTFKNIKVVTDEYTFKMDGKTNLYKFYNNLGDPEHATDGRLDYTDELGYKYTFDCCNEGRKGTFRGFVIKYPVTAEQ